MTAMLHANRKTIRTVFQTFVALCAAAPVLIAQSGLDSVNIPWVASAVGVILAGAAIVTRAMNTPRVEAILARFAPWLAAQPAAPVVDAPAPVAPAAPTEPPAPPAA